MTHRYRITFGKGPELRFTGHLDLHRAWERTFRRAEVPLAYSQGFKPRPKINIGAALPLGSTSEEDLIEVELTEAVDTEGLLEMLREAAPPGLNLVLVEGVPEGTPKLQKRLKAAEYVIPLPPDSVPELAARIEVILNSDELLRVRRGKEYDLRPLIEVLSQKGSDGEAELQMRLTAHSGATGRPDEVLKALELDPQALTPHRVRLVLDESFDAAQDEPLDAAQDEPLDAAQDEPFDAAQDV